MQNLPAYIGIVFAITTALTVWLFYKAANNSKTTLLVLLVWLTLQSAIGLSGFYTVTSTFPPRFLLMVLPPLLLIIGLFSATKGRQFIDSLDIRTLTILHVVRTPVEVVLFWLSVYKAVPVLMTFEGRNYDIFSGLSAPFFYYFGFMGTQTSRRALLVWNVICLALLINIVVLAVLSAPFTFQRFAFNQPNIAVLHFPFNWLPGCIVPVVLFSHLVTIRQILKNKAYNY